MNSTSDEISDIEFMEPMTSALMSLESNEVYGNGVFMLNWSALNSRFSDNKKDELGMAMAIGFDGEVLLKPPYSRSTVEMGSVSIESANGEMIELRKQPSRLSGAEVVYIHRSFGPFSDQASLTYDGGGEYTIRTSGSDVFPSLNLSATSPDKQVLILSPSENSLENYSGDLELNWDALSDKPVAIHIRPSFNPKESEKPGQFNREDSEMILLEDHNGTYTISAETLSEIAGHSKANSVHVSVGQLHVNDFEYGGQTYRIIMRMADHRLVELD